MGDDVQLANLLVTMQSNLSSKIDDAKKELSTEIGEVKDTQAAHGRALASHAERHEELRRMVEDRTGGIGLTKAQKAALWTGISGLAVEGLRHLKSLIFGLVCLMRGVRL